MPNNPRTREASGSRGTCPVRYSRYISPNVLPRMRGTPIRLIRQQAPPRMIARVEFVRG